MNPQDKTPEEIEREMLQTRESMTEKVTALENQVIGTAHSVTSAVSDTVAKVKSLVSSAPGAVSDTVKQTFAAVKEQLDITGMVRRNPMASVGVSAGAGFLLGYLLSGRRESPNPIAAMQPPVTPQPSSAPREPGFFDDLLGQVSREVKRLAQDAIASTSAALKQNISTEVPKLIDGAVHRGHPERVGV
ncbi:MAG TPA: hypothetical protein VMZ71_06625 [Gemmataceae bacterium]|nr:hypothetical protein [Gemmataceae bacterium]